MWMCHTAQSQITDKMIVNCSWNAGFIKKNEYVDPLDEDVPQLDILDDSTGITFNEYVTLDENVAVCGEILDKTF